MRARLVIATLIGTIFGAVLVVLAVLGLGVFHGASDGKSARIELSLPDLEDVHIGAVDLVGPRRPTHVLYLNREGATLQPGLDDAAANRASLLLLPPPKSSANRPSNAKDQHEHAKPLRRGGGPVTLPPFRGTDARWRAIVACLRDQFAPFDLEVTDRRPDHSDYLMAVFGGTAVDAGYPAGIGGLAPFNGHSIDQAVVLVFTRALGERTREVCETAAMEIAHTFGLDHEYLCKDPMTYLHNCGEKSFQDKSAPCGEKSPRLCHDGAPTQNSYRRLMEALGPRKSLARP